MTNETSASLSSSVSPESGATDLQWPPPWWRWLIFALSGTVEIERQAALQEQRHRQQMIEQHLHNEELRKSNEELREQNERLAELESKIDGLFSKYDINSPLVNKPEQP
jgi:hypothetical protein